MQLGLVNQQQPPSQLEALHLPYQEGDFPLTTTELVEREFQTGGIK
jgi:hypothetical protein